MIGLLVAVGALAGAAAVLLNGEGGDHGRAPHPPAMACAGPLLGVNSVLELEGERGRAASIAAIQGLGARVVRLTLRWNWIEPERGELDWSAMDGTLAQLSAARIEPLLVIVGSPRWASGAPAGEQRPDLYVPPPGPRFSAWLDRYARFVSAAVERYGDAVRLWEIWNEPNLAKLWRPRPDPSEYRRLYERLRATILSLDPGAEVAVGGLAGLTVASSPSLPGRAFLRRLARTHPPLDAVAVHAYATGEHGPEVHVPGENNFDDVDRVHDELVREGYRVPIWITEWGWSSVTVGVRRQARYVRQSLAMIRRGFPFVPVATYFLDRDLPPAFRGGLLTRHLRPKPAARAFRSRAARIARTCRPSQPEGG